ncbi:MAG: DUF1015 domain-containing protein [Candidatus Sumerlaeaceae bacterium]|nr:DUF1015 domain-containing protein [Candidatus Sumerlaeaceae bacterium]
MADILPFRGTRYNNQLIDDLSKVISPPYDVISKEMQEALYQRHPNNIVRIILTKEEADENFSDKYVQAANYFRTWRSEGILIEDHQPSLYLYEQEFKLPDGTKKSRKGFFALLKLQDYSEGGVRAHEHTFAGPKADRFKLLQATRANLSPIFLIYKDPEQTVSTLIEERMREARPWAKVTDEDGVVHKLWVVSKKDFIAAVREKMAPKELFIADGHHRYETAVAYREFMRAQTGLRDGRQPFDYTMVYLTHAEQDGLVILPTHRALSKSLMSEIDFKEAFEELKESFDITTEKVDLAKGEGLAARILEKTAELGKKKTSFAMIEASGKVHYLQLKKNARPEELIDDDDMPEVVKRLDVSILHHYIINRVFIGNPEFELEEDECFYVRDVIKLFEMLRSKKAALAFVMNPTPMEQVLEIVAAGIKMPHKSTYFHPKLADGLVMRDMALELGRKTR